MFRLVLSLVACVAFACSRTVGAQHLRIQSDPIALRDLVPSDDPLAVHDLRFDASFVQEAMARSHGVLPGKGVSPTYSFRLSLRGCEPCPILPQA